MAGTADSGAGGTAATVPAPTASTANASATDGTSATRPIADLMADTPGPSVTARLWAVEPADLLTRYRRTEERLARVGILIAPKLEGWNASRQTFPPAPRTRLELPAA